MNPFQSLHDYEYFVYTLPTHYPGILHTTLVLARRGRTYAELTGDLILADGYRLTVYERLTWERGPLTIEDYGYEAWRGSEELYWYDSQPHPNDPTLASTGPHHKHVPPDIKHHRIPAPGLSLAEPNLPPLIKELGFIMATREFDRTKGG